MLCSVSCRIIIVYGSYQFTMLLWPYAFYRWSRTISALSLNTRFNTANEIIQDVPSREQKLKKMYIWKALLLSTPVIALRKTACRWAAVQLWRVSKCKQVSYCLTHVCTPHSMNEPALTAYLSTVPVLYTQTPGHAQTICCITEAYTPLFSHLMIGQLCNKAETKWPLKVDRKALQRATQHLQHTVSLASTSSTPSMRIRLAVVVLHAPSFQRLNAS